MKITSEQGVRVLVAGIGNIFFGDDGFGPAVATALLSRARAEPLPADVRVVDYGIRGMYLTYDLLEGVDVLVLVDAVPPDGPAGAPPGTVTLMAVGPDDIGAADFDAHAMSPVAVLASLGSMGATLPPTYLVGCVPADLDEGIGLSDPVNDAVDEAVAAVNNLVCALGSGRLDPPAQLGFQRGG